MPKMKHPDSPRVIDVGPGQVPMYESQGWEKHTPVSRKPKKPTNTAATANTKE